MKKDISLSVVLPAYNESENIEKTITHAVSYLEKTFRDYEVIVVNDGSVDGTPRIVEKLATSNARVVLVNHPKNLGYGSALRSGFERASLDYIFLMDSDGQFDISDIDRFIPFLESYDVVVGYREKRADPFIRSLNAQLYHLFIRLLFGLKLKDIDCAFKMFPRSVYHAVRPIESGGALFSAEFLVKLKQKGFTIREVSVRHFPRRFGRQTGANLKVIIRMFKECWKLRDKIGVSKGSGGTLLELNWFFPALLAFGFMIRILLSLYWTYEGDFGVWKWWAGGISKVGFSQFYDKYWCDYMPGYLYILWFLDHIRSAFPRLPDKIIFKLPANLSDLGISILIFFVLRKITTVKNAKIVSLAYLFNPASLSNSTFWGQVDSVHAFPLLLSVAFGLWGNFILSGVFAAIAFMIKPQSVVIFPIIGFFALRHVIKQKEGIASSKTIILGVEVLAAMVIASFIIILPFIWYKLVGHGIEGVFREPFYFIRERFGRAYNQYTYASLNAFNFWGMVAMWQDDQIRFLGITYQSWGTIIFGIFYALILGLLFCAEVIEQSNTGQSSGHLQGQNSTSARPTTRAICAITLILFALFLFITRAHERHFLPTIVFFTFIAFRSRMYWLFYVLISAAYVFNMFYSYIELMPRISESAKPYLIIPASSLRPFISGVVLLLLIVFFVVLIDFVRNSIGLYRGESS
ncbi:MAG: glycosyltransferase [Ignavibacteriales bacterium]